MFKCEEGFFRNHNNEQHFFQAWFAENSNGTLVVTHGMAEHSDCYRHFAEAMSKYNWSVVAWDLEGHGRSEGKRGHVRQFRDFAKSLQIFWKLVETDARTQNKPLVALGHSMGGLITLQALMQFSFERLAAVALSSPLLAISMPVPWIKDFAARFILKVVPDLTLNNEIVFEELTHDRELLQSYYSDPYRHSKISPALYLGMLEAMAVVRAQPEKLQLPILFQLSGQDKVVSTPVAQDFYEKIPSSNKTIHIYKDSYHEIFNDIQRETVFHDLHKFLQKNTTP